MRKIIAVVLASFMPIQLWAATEPAANPKTEFPCVLQVSKNTCWKDYDVKVSAKMQEDSKELIALTIAKDKDSATGTWKCKPNDQFFLNSSFAPAVWKEEEGKSYRSSKVYQVPESVEAKAESWNVSACFPDDFAQVPMPDKEMKNCGCAPAAEKKDTPPKVEASVKTEENVASEADAESLLLEEDTD